MARGNRSNVLVGVADMYTSSINFSGIAVSATTGATPTIVLDNTASAENDTYNGCEIIITWGTGVGQIRTIADYTGASKTITVNADWDELPDTTSHILIAKWTAVGYTKEGITYAYEQSSQDIKVDQEIGAIMRFKDDEKVMVSTNMSEITLENIKLAMNLESDTLQNGTSAKSLMMRPSEYFEEFALKLVGKSPQKKDRIYLMLRVSSDSKINNKFVRNDMQTIGVTFHAFAETNVDAYGYVIDYK